MHVSPVGGASGRRPGRGHDGHEHVGALGDTLAGVRVGVHQQADLLRSLARRWSNTAVD